MRRGSLDRFVQRVANLPDWQWGCLLFLTTLAVRFAVFAALNRWEVILRSEVEQIAISLLQTGRFADPYHFPTGLTAHSAPVYPFLLSLLFRIFGTGLGGEWADQAFSVLLAAFTFASLPFLSRQIFGENLPGILAGATCALVPSFFLVETQGKEAPLSSLLFLLLILLSCLIWRRRSFTPRTALFYGLSWALMLLSHPGFLLVMLGILALCGLTTDISPRPARRRFCLLTVAVCAAGISPWLIRNYAVFGQLFFIRDNLGLELSLSNHDTAQAAMDDNVKAGYFRRHPWRSKEEAALIQQIGEYAYHQQRKQEALGWIFAHPVPFLRLTAARAFHFWIPIHTKPYQWIVVALLNVAAWAGLILLSRANPRLARAWGAVWLLYSLPFLFIQADLRYYYPIFWTCSLLAAYAAVNAVRHFGAFLHRRGTVRPFQPCAETSPLG